MLAGKLLVTTAFPRRFVVFKTKLRIFAQYPVAVHASYVFFHIEVSKFGHFRSHHDCPSSLSCINEYLAIDSGGNVSEYILGT